MNRFGVSSIGVCLLGIVVNGCSGSSSGGFVPLSPSAVGGTSNPAVQATLSQLEIDIRARQLLDPSISVSPISAPSVFVVSDYLNVPLGAQPSDGTVTNVDVRTTGTAGATPNLTTTISDTATGDVFVQITTQHDAISAVTFHDVPSGTATLAADGTGQAFIVARVTHSGTANTTFVNQPATATLIDFTGITPIPDGTTTATFTTTNEYLIQYVITLSGGVPVAQISQWWYGTAETARTPVGGPQTTLLQQNLSLLVADGQDFTAASGPLAIPVGPDLPNSVIDGAAMTYNLTASGGPATPFNRTTYGVTPTDSGTLGGAHAYAGNLSTLLLADGIVQVAFFNIDSASVVDPTPTGAVLHTVDNLLGSLEELIALPAAARFQRRVTLFH